MNLVILLVAYSIAMVASSLLGGCLPGLFRLTHVRMQVMLSFVGGTMLGVGLLHMLAHSIVELGSMDAALLWTLVGLLGMFLLIRTFHFHEHGVATVDEDEAGPGGDFEATCHDHAHHDHSPAGHSHAGHSHAGSGSSLSWIGVAFGLSLHALLDGVALGAGVLSDSAHRGTFQWAGLGVFLAILLHKPLDALSITALMQANHWSRRSQWIVNGLFALTCPLGALLFVACVPEGSQTQRQWVGVALAIAAGIFLCISLSDLLPEVQFHRHDRLKLSAALILGVLCAYAIRYLEPAHAHAFPGTQEGEAAHGHDHAGHDHAGHDHAGHDHAGHDHAGHDHAGHDHGPADGPSEALAK
jgi:zinc and cadmium transporter